MRFLPVFLIFFFPLVPVCHAEENGIPEIVLTGFETYQKYGAPAAINDWLKGSPFEASDKDHGSRRMTSVESIYGRMVGFELFRTVRLTPSTRRVYILVKFEKGAAWMSFECYKPVTAWIILKFDFSTKADEIVPPDLLAGQ